MAKKNGLAAAGMGLALALAAAPGCDTKAPPPAPAPVEAPKTAEPPKPPPPSLPDAGLAAAAPADAAPPKSKMVANPDGLSLVERIEKRKAAESKLAGELAAAENKRLLKYDKGKLPLHTQVFTFIKKTRAQYDALEKKVRANKNKELAAAAVEKTRAGLEKSIVATGKKLQSIDPKGGNSNVTTDYDVMLNALATDYPMALIDSLEGDGASLAEQKADLNKRTAKIESWLAAAKKAK